jgi:L-ascorbate metabolism protein UlaG (beta-lactamase superfamily)
VAAFKEFHLPSSKENVPDFIRGSIFFVGTDPNFLHAGGHVHLGYGMTAEQLTNPAIDIENLPPIDFCILSHYHGDHFDQVAETYHFEIPEHPIKRA